MHLPIISRPAAAASQNALVSGLGCGAWILRSSFAMASLPLHDHRCRTMPGAERAAGAVGNRQVAILDLNGGVGFAPQLAHRLDYLGQTAAVGRMVVAQPTAIGVERQFAGAGDQIAVGYKPAALSLLAEAEILDLHQDGDRKAVVDRGVFDVGGSHPGLGKS